MKNLMDRDRTLVVAMPTLGSVQEIKPGLSGLWCQMKKLCIASLVAVTLTGCGGGGVEVGLPGVGAGTPAPVAAPTLPPVADNPPAPPAPYLPPPIVTTPGDAQLGQSAYGTQCIFCHGDFDTNTGISAGAADGTNPLNVVSYAQASTHEVVANYIAAAMPPAPFDPASCGQECADNITRYFFTLGQAVLDSGNPIAAGGGSTFSGSGQQAFKDFGCVACHGNDGLQESQPIIFDNYTLESLIAKIDVSMPISPVDDDAWKTCVGDCAKAVGEYLWSIRPMESCDVGEKVLPRRVRNLTKFEYSNTINDLFGRNDGEALASGIGSDTEVKGFDNNAYANSVTITQMDSYWNAAKDIAQVVDVRPWLSTNNCNVQGMSACFVSKFGRSAFRRPLINEEMDDYTDIFDAGSNDEEGARFVVQAMLVSPNFLYRSEIGTNGRLTQYEVASLLSYTFWGSTPDEALLDMAANNRLGDTGQIKSAVEQLLTDTKAERQFVHFGRQWLQVDEVAELNRGNTFPAFTNGVASAMDRELELFLQEMLLRDGYNMNDFFTWDQTFANNTLANFYNLNGAGNQMTKIDAGPNRGGVLRLGAVLLRNSKLDESHPIKRGLLVRSHLLCQEFGAPPPNVGEVEPFDPTKPTRERFTAHSENEACASCHQYIDEIGFAFENYDAVGQFRTSEANGAAVDATGTISGLEIITGSDSHSFTDLNGLANILGESAQRSTSSCLAEQFQRMMDGEAKPDSCTVDNTVARWNPNVNSLKDLWVEMVSSQTFTLRQ